MYVRVCLISSVHHVSSIATISRSRRRPRRPRSHPRPRLHARLRHPRPPQRPALFLLSIHLAHLTLAALLFVLAVFVVLVCRIMWRGLGALELPYPFPVDHISTLKKLGRTTHAHSHVAR